MHHSRALCVTHILLTAITQSQFRCFLTTTPSVMTSSPWTYGHTSRKKRIEALAPHLSLLTSPVSASVYRRRQADWRCYASATAWRRRLTCALIWRHGRRRYVCAWWRQCWRSRLLRTFPVHLRSESIFETLCATMFDILGLCVLWMWAFPVATNLRQ